MSCRTRVPVGLLAILCTGVSPVPTALVRRETPSRVGQTERSSLLRKNNSPSSASCIGLGDSQSSVCLLGPPVVLRPLVEAWEQSQYVDTTDISAPIFSKIYT